MGRRKMDSELHRIKLETGTVYQTSKGGNYYFRYQINGERKCISLKTAHQEEAVRKARELFLPSVPSDGTASVNRSSKPALSVSRRESPSPLKPIFYRTRLLRP